MPPITEGVVPRLVLCNVSMATVPLEDMVAAAADNGFDAISVLGRNHRSAHRRGFSDGDIAKLVADRGLVVDSMEALGDWLSEPPDGPPWMSPVYSTDEYLDYASAIGAESLVVVHFGEPRPFDASVEAFARLCERAGERGLRIALEFPAWATIGDVATAWEIVRAADRDNGGLLIDNWHHRRGGNDDDALQAVDAVKIFCIQLSDADAETVGPLEEDVLHRRLPGEGALGVADFVRTMIQRGVTASVGVEVFDEQLLAGGPQNAARRLMESLRVVLGQD